jgi:Xaa-Pro aminopeptidase
MLSRFLILLSVVIFNVSDTIAQRPPDNFESSWMSEWEISCNIRKDKFDYVLPNAMRRNNIDMWIVIDRGRGTEPMILDFGIETAYGHGIYVFYDGGGERIERYSLGGPGSSVMADICGAYDTIEDGSNLRSIVEERDPKRIALNYLDPLIIGEGVHTADGLSHKDYNFLVEELGEKYAGRLVSAQRLIADFHGEHVAGEIIEFSKVGDITRRGIERALSNEVITPGKTTYFEVIQWMEEYRKSLGLHRTWLPGVGFQGPYSREEYRNLGRGEGVNRVFMGGDVLSSDWGLNRNNFSTDIKRFAYVLKEDEETAPPGILKAFDEAMKIREIIRKNVRSGRTGREQLDELKQHIRNAGYVYTNVERPSDIPDIEVIVALHGMGNIAHDVAAGLDEWFTPELTEYMIRPNAIISLEFFVYAPVDEWNGKKITVAIEENVLVTDRGLEWLYSPQDRVLLIR